MTESKEKNKNILLIAFLALMWGSSFILMKRALVVYTPYQIGALRIFSAFIALSPLIFSRIRFIEKRKWKFFIASGLLGNGIPSILFPLAETRINSGLAGMLNTLTPIFTLIVGVIWFGMKVGRSRVFGLFIGLAGAILMLSDKVSSNSYFQISSYALFIVLATICYGFSVNILRYKLSDTDSLTNATFALFSIGFPAGIYLFSTDFITRTTSVDGSGFAILCILLLGLLSTALSTVLFNRLIKTSGALAASSVTYLIPVVAVLWGFYDNEILGWNHLAGLLAILTGVYIVNRRS